MAFVYICVCKNNLQYFYIINIFVKVESLKCIYKTISKQIYNKLVKYQI